MSILSTSPVNTRHFDMEMATTLGDINAAVIVQQLHYWMQKEGVGTVIDGVKYVYNTFDDWVRSQFRWLSVWQFRKAMSLLRSLSIVKVKRYKAKQWNQTNYYSLDYDRLWEYLKSQMPQSIEISEMCVSTAQDVNNQHLKVSSCTLSNIGTKKTPKEKTAKAGEQKNSQLEKIAAAPTKIALKEEDKPKQSIPHSAGLTAPVGQKKQQSGNDVPNTGKENKVGRIDYIVNKHWKEQIQELDSTGIPTNKTLMDLVKIYEPEQVERAIALFKVRKREQHIQNPTGYFVAALKEDWTSKNLVSSESGAEIDAASVFRHWYDLAIEVGYCSRQEVREGEQWVCLSGSWEKWSDAIARGYSLDYLKKVLKRYKGQ